MTRTLIVLAAVSFLFAVAALSAAFAIAGGPFSIDDRWTFHRWGESHPVSTIADPRAPAPVGRLNLV